MNHIASVQIPQQSFSHFPHFPNFEQQHQQHQQAQQGMMATHIAMQHQQQTHQQVHHPRHMAPHSPSSTDERLHAAREMLRLGTETSDINNAEIVLYKACEVLENWADDFEEQQAQRHTSEASASSTNHRHQQHQHQQHHFAPASPAAAPPAMVNGHLAQEPDQQDIAENPFCVMLAQAKHRLAQVCLLRGNLEVACRLFLQVLLHDPDTLSPAALAMAWYDVGLIYITYGKVEHAQAALKQALVLLYSQATANNSGGNNDSNSMDTDTATAAPHGHVDETMQFFIQQAIKQTTSMQHGIPPFHLGTNNLPWSVQFTMTTYSYDDPTTEQQAGDSRSPQDFILEETQRLLDPSVHHAAAA